MSIFKILLSAVFISGTVWGIVFLLYLLFSKEKELKLPQLQFNFQIAVAVADTLVLSILGFPLIVIVAVVASATFWIVETMKRQKDLLSSFHK